MAIIPVLLEAYKKNKPNNYYKQLTKESNQLKNKQIINGLKKLNKHMNHILIKTILNEKKP